jgi:hypothetical protein
VVGENQGIRADKARQIILKILESCKSWFRQLTMQTFPSKRVMRTLVVFQ